MGQEEGEDVNGRHSVCEGLLRCSRTEAKAPKKFTAEGVVDSVACGSKARE